MTRSSTHASSLFHVFGPMWYHLFIIQKFIVAKNFLWEWLVSFATWNFTIRDHGIENIIGQVIPKDWMISHARSKRWGHVKNNQPALQFVAYNGVSLTALKVVLVVHHQCHCLQGQTTRWSSWFHRTAWWWPPCRRCSNDRDTGYSQSIATMDVVIVPPCFRMPTLVRWTNMLSN